MKKILIGLTLLFLVGTTAQAGHTVAEGLANSGFAYIYLECVANCGEKPVHYIVVMDEEAIEVVCSIDGVITVTFNSKDYVCDPKLMIDEITSKRLDNKEYDYYLNLDIVGVRLGDTGLVQWEITQDPGDKVYDKQCGRCIRERDTGDTREEL